MDFSPSSFFRILTPAANKQTDYGRIEKRDYFHKHDAV